MKLKKLKTFLAAVLAACMSLGLAACSGKDLDTPVEPEPVPAPFAPAQKPDKREPVDLGRTEVPSLDPSEGQPEGGSGMDAPVEDEPGEDAGLDEEVVTPVRTDDFNSSFMGYMDGIAGDRSYVVSPSSLRAALCLAAVGADGSTLDGLLGALGFESLEEAERWYGGVIESVEEFNRMLENSRTSDEPLDGAFRFLCAAWANQDAAGGFLPDYERYVQTRFGAPSMVVPGAELGRDLTEWGKKATDGLIDLGNPDLSDAELVLANAVYLRAEWLHTFNEFGTKKDLFHAADGTDVEMDFMSVTEDFPYLDDGEARYLALPMRGDKFFLARLGGEDGCGIGSLLAALPRMESTNVHVTMPKLDMENMWSGGSLTGYLEAMGAGEALHGGEADFSKMAEWDPYIAEILQKTRLKTDEDGLEAAAVTALIMDKASIGMLEEPVEFRMDEPFAFAVCSGNLYECMRDGIAPEVLFAGRFTGIV